MYKSHYVRMDETQVNKVKKRTCTIKGMWHKVKKLVEVCLVMEEDSLDDC